MWCCLWKKILKTLFLKSYKSDTKSAFGGIIFLNRKVKLNLAKKIVKIFLKWLLQQILIKNAIKN